MDAKGDYRTLGMGFMMLGMSLGVTFGLTLGWAFAPIGLSFIALGIVFLGMKKEDET